MPPRFRRGHRCPVPAPRWSRCLLQHPGLRSDPVVGHLLCAPAAGTFRGPGALCFLVSKLHRLAVKECSPQAAARSLTEAVYLFQETLTHQRCKIKALQI